MKIKILVVQLLFVLVRFRKLFNLSLFFKKMKIKDINLNSKGKVIVEGFVQRIVQTGGPTIFVVSDGTGMLSLKGFIKPGERAYPEIEEDEGISANIVINEFQGELEGEIKNINILKKDKKDSLLKEIEIIEKERATPEVVDFMVKSPILDKLKDSFVKAATEIRLAVMRGRPIIVRHHNDTDGYCSGFVLERAILPLIQKQHKSPKASWEFFTRAPCAAPFYELTDSIIDTAFSLRNVAKFSNKMPLIVIADNGSSPEDLMAIKQAKIHGADFIVVDHHGFDKDVISEEVKVHINPHLVEESGASFSAGMLCAELARFVNKDVNNVEQIPALAGLADRIDLENPKVIKDYLKLAEAKGYSKELLRDISIVIEYVSTRVRFMEVREYMEVLFGEPRDKQKNLVNLMAPHIRKLDAKGLAIAKMNAKIEEVGDTTLQSLEIDKIFPGFGFFPKPGRCVGLVHDNLQKEKGIKNLVSAGIMNTAITLRATDGANFSVHRLIKFLDEKLPNAFVEGGGHKNAGSINFLPNKREEVLKYFMEFMKK